MGVSYNKLIVLIFSALLITGVAAYQSQTSDIWLNLFSEAIGVAFTVLIIDGLIKIGEQRKTKPARYAAFQEALMIYGRSTGMMLEIVRASFDPVRDKEIINRADINLLHKDMGEIIKFLNLESDAPVIPKRTWRVYLHQHVQEMEERIDKCLQRYSAFMEPDLIEALQGLERTSFIIVGKLLLAMPIADKEIGYVRHPYFGWGGNGTLDDFYERLLILGKLISLSRQEFSGMPKIPDEIDLQQMNFIKDLRDRTQSLP